MRMSWRRASVLAATAALVAGGAAATAATGATASPKPGTSTPIKHLVVIFQENVSFDHYFGTYPTAANTSGQPFTGPPGTRRRSMACPRNCSGEPERGAILAGTTRRPWATC